MFSFYNLFRKIAFSLDAEFIHEKTLKILSNYPFLLSKLFCLNNISEKKYCLNLNGLKWSFPVGLAAGLDKNAIAFDFFSNIGFGAVEVGTVTLRPQEGNPPPRLFRYPDEYSLRNSLGFNNMGAEIILNNILSYKNRNSLLGVNISKNKDIPSDKAIYDYIALYEKFSSTADYLVINVSSPNTPGLRELQSKEFLKDLFNSLKDVRERFPCPLFLKVSPDIEREDARDISEVAKSNYLSGIIATNTTIIKSRGVGGISGKLLASKSVQVRQWFLDFLRECPNMDVIGVGGVSSFNDLWQFWKSGGKVIQIYTALIYKGPYILKEISMGIDNILQRENISSLEDLLENIDNI